MVYAQTRIGPREWDAWNSQEFWDLNRSPNPGQRKNKKKKKRACRIEDLVVPADHRVKINEREERQVFDLAREQRKLWNMWVTVIPIVIGAYGTVFKGLERMRNRGTNRDYPDYCIVEIGH